MHTMTGRAWRIMILMLALVVSACGGGGGGGGGAPAPGGGGGGTPPPPGPSTVLGSALLLESATPQARNPQIAVTANGAAIAVWAQSDGNNLSHIWARHYAPNQGWDTAASIDNAGATKNAIGAPSVAIDGQGRAVAVWVQPDLITPNDIGSLWVNRYDPTTGWGTATVIDSGTSYVTLPKVTMNTAGTAVVVWTQFDGTHSRAYANRLRAGQTAWDGPITLDNNTTHVESLWPTFLNVAVDSIGNTAVTWVQKDATTATTDNLNAAYIPATATWVNGVGGVTTLGQAIDSATTTTTLFTASLVANNNGEAIVAWDLWSNDTATSTLTFALHARQYSAGGWVAPVALGEGTTPKLASDGLGHTLLVASAANSAINNSSALAIAHSSTSGWGNRTLIDGASGATPEVAMNASGNAMAVWSYVEGTYPSNRYRLRASYFNGTTWSTAGQLDNQGTGDTSSHVVGLDGAGNATALWLQDGYSVWANRFGSP